MRSQQEYLKINPKLLRRVMEAEGLEHWWVAECAGVHRSTLRRWLCGRITKVKRENAEKLQAVIKEMPLSVEAGPLFF